MSENTETAILAGGCFWGMQELIRNRPGVVSTRVGWSGGDTLDPSEANPGIHARATTSGTDYRSGWKLPHREIAQRGG